MSEPGISGRGRSAEEAFRAITGAGKPARASDGDALLGGHPVEVKRATNGTLNQVRAVKYIPLVARHEPSDTWYVVPAHDVVRLVSEKARGQHTENPFESATLSVSHLSDYRVPEAELKAATLKAIQSADEYPEIRENMNQVLEESRELARRSVARVRQTLSRAELL